MESEERVDRNKVGSVEDLLLVIVEKIKASSYTFSQQDFTGLEALNGDELLIGKITNVLNFIIAKLNSGMDPTAA